MLNKILGAFGRSDEPEAESFSPVNGDTADKTDDIVCYDLSRVPFDVAYTATFIITDSFAVTQRFETGDDALRQANEVVRGAIRLVIASAEPLSAEWSLELMFLQVAQETNIMLQKMGIKLEKLNVTNIAQQQ